MLPCRPGVGATWELGQELPTPHQCLAESCACTCDLLLQFLQFLQFPWVWGTTGQHGGWLAIGAEPGKTLGQPGPLHICTHCWCSSGQG